MMISLKEAENDDRRENGWQAGWEDYTCHREKELASAVKSIGESVTGVQGDVSQTDNVTIIRGSRSFELMPSSPGRRAQ
jgi:hypothetical protein